MARYGSQSEMDHDWPALVAAPAWPPPAPLADDDEDWSGALGCCDALRPAAEPPAALPEDDDWGYGAEAM
jgi:hypothetical protein